MLRPLYRYGRWIALPLTAWAIAAIGVHYTHPASETLLAAPDASTLSQADPTTRPIDESDYLDSSDTIDVVGLQARFESVAAKVAPAVVAVSAAETATDSDDATRADDLNGQKLQDLLGKTTRTVGSGFIIDQSGFILTNEHVIEDSEQFWVTTDDHRVYPAVVVAADPRADLAVLKIPANNLPTVRLNSAGCQRGQWAITLGNPYGLATEGEMSLSVGVISAVDRALPHLANRENRLYTHLIQTTAQINPGNSGGPLFNLEGEVIGVNAAVILPQRQTNGIGFALPITPQLLSEVASLRQGKEIAYSYLGVIVTTPTPSERQQLNLTDISGARIESTEPASPAAAPGGLQVGDIVIAMQNQKIADSDQFVRQVGSWPIGQPLHLQVLRDGHSKQITLTPIKRPIQYAICEQTQRLHWRGALLGPIPDNWLGATAIAAASKDKRVSGLLVIAVNDDSPLKSQGLSPGSVVTAIGGRPVNSILEMQTILNELPPSQCSLQLAPTIAQVVSVQK
ncbi:MAG: trypsin-like peptidase domain-containing protein [Tepidisphaeraceae bacterium]|jgi:serine protease Do